MPCRQPGFSTGTMLTCMLTPADPCFADVLRTMHVLLTRGGVMDLVSAAARQQAQIGHGQGPHGSGSHAVHTANGHEVGCSMGATFKPQPTAMKMRMCRHLCHAPWKGVRWLTRMPWRRPHRRLASSCWLQPLSRPWCATWQRPSMTISTSEFELCAESALLKQTASGKGSSVVLGFLGQTRLTRPCNPCWHVAGV